MHLQHYRVHHSFRHDPSLDEWRGFLRRRENHRGSASAQFSPRVRHVLLPQTILGTVVLVLSGLFGYSIYTLSDLGYAISGDDNNSKNAIIGGCICFVVSYIVLTFVVMILLNVVDAVFVCYAVDKDRSTIHHPDLHQIFNDVTERQTAKQRTEQENDDANTKYSSV